MGQDLSQNESAFLGRLSRRLRYERALRWASVTAGSLALFIFGFELLARFSPLPDLRIILGLSLLLLPLLAAILAAVGLGSRPDDRRDLLSKAGRLCGSSGLFLSRFSNGSRLSPVVAEHAARAAARGMQQELPAVSIPSWARRCALLLAPALLLLMAPGRQESPAEKDAAPAGSIAASLARKNPKPETVPAARHKMRSQPKSSLISWSEERRAELRQRIAKAARQLDKSQVTKPLAAAARQTDPARLQAALEEAERRLKKAPAKGRKAAARAVALALSTLGSFANAPTQDDLTALATGSGSDGADSLAALRKGLLGALEQSGRYERQLIVLSARAKGRAGTHSEAGPDPDAASPLHQSSAMSASTWRPSGGSRREELRLDVIARRYFARRP